MILLEPLVTLDEYYNAAIVLLEFWIVPILMGAVMPPIYRWARWGLKTHWVFQVFQSREGVYFLVKTVFKRLGVDGFHVGEREFVVPANPPVSHYDGSNPVLNYILDKSKPRKVKIEPTQETFDDKLPKGEKDPSSASTNWLFRRKGLQGMAAATKGGIHLREAMPLIIMVGITGITLGYVIFNYWHPGLFPAPPPGYEYKVVPIPANATVVTK